MFNEEAIDDIFLKQRGYVTRVSSNKKAVMIISGGLDSIATGAFLIQELGMELFPLHIQRGQTNAVAENKSVDFFSHFFIERFGEEKFHKPEVISVNIPPVEFKPDLMPYVKKKGHPMRDPIMHLLGVQYAVAVSQKYKIDVKSVLCAIVPEDYFPHSTLFGLRSTMFSTCINMGDWEWQITSPNIDANIIPAGFSKKDEISWAMKNEIPIGKTISCNDARKETNHLACGICSSCQRRKQAFADAGFEDPTEYFSKK